MFLLNLSGKKSTFIVLFQKVITANNAMFQSYTAYAKTADIRVKNGNPKFSIAVVKTA